MKVVQLANAVYPRGASAMDTVYGAAAGTVTNSAPLMPPPPQCLVPGRRSSKTFRSSSILTSALSLVLLSRRAEKNKVTLNTSCTARETSYSAYWGLPFGVASLFRPVQTNLRYGMLSSHSARHTSVKSVTVLRGTGQLSCRIGARRSYYGTIARQWRTCSLHS